MTEKQQAEYTIESDATGVFVVFRGVRIAKRGEGDSMSAFAADGVNMLISVVDDEPDVEVLFR